MTNTNIIQEEDARNKARSYKETTYDEYIAGEITSRVIRHYQIIDSNKYNYICKKVLPLVKSIVNEPVLDVLFSGNDYDGHIGRLSRQQQKLLKPTNELEKQLRQLVKYVYGNDASKKFIRLKVEGCMAVTIANMNSTHFQNEIDHYITTNKT